MAISFCAVLLVFVVCLFLFGCLTTCLEYLGKRHVQKINEKQLEKKIVQLKEEKERLETEIKEKEKNF